MPPYEKPKTAYDFITAPPQAQAKKSFFAGGYKQRLPLIAGGGVALLFVVILLSSLLNSGPSNQDTLLRILQQQTELSRVAQLGVKDAEQTTMNLAYNTSVTAQSDQAKLVTSLAAKNVKFKDKQLAVGKDTKTDELLTAARAASNFDETFLQTLDEQLEDYQATLQDAYTNSGSKEVKTTLSDSYANSKLLRTQLETAKR